MQYEKDMQSPFVALFQEIRSMLLNLEGIEEIRKTRITTYIGKKSALCHLRTTKQGVDIGFLKGAKFEDEYGRLSGDGKTLRVLSLTACERKLIEYYLSQGLREVGST